MIRTLPFLVFATACLPDFPKRDFTEDPTHDGDGDGITELDGDCDDAEPLAYPGAQEVCDGIDNDCDGDADEDDALDAVIWYSDGDRDGFGTDAFTVKACAAPSEAYADNDDDCNDSVAEINPDASETCAPFDENCDGVINEGEGDTGGAGSTLDTDTWYKDTDLDGYGRDDETIESCDRPEGYVLDGGDCDDGNADISPRETEHCDGIDNDCDGLTDDDDPGMVGEGTWYADTDGDGFGNPMSDTLEQCSRPDGHVLDATDCDDDNADINPDGVESCNDADDDCDGLVDDGVTLDFFADTDGDGHGDLATPTEACAVPEGYTTSFDDCDDTDPLVHPDADELCATEGIDDNCDGRVDEADAADATTWYRDADGDGFGDGDTTLVQCTVALTYVAEPGDCDDSRATSYPGAPELCGTPTRDDDCDGDLNDDGAEGCTEYWYDGDGDGYGDASLSQCLCLPDSDSDYDSLRSDDCDDSLEAVHPEQAEDCTTLVDDNCSGGINDEDAIGCTPYWQDTDDDGFGLDDTMLCLCVADGSRSAEEDGDCNDMEFAINPGEDELCADAIDNNCDGLINDATSVDAVVWYRDDDGDGYGVETLTETACEEPDGHTATAGDCDDSRDGINPGVVENCVTIWDDDCSGSTNDLGALNCVNFYADNDGDGYGVSVDSECMCVADTATIYTSRVVDDCDDTSAGISPGDIETCDTAGIDDDCSGVADDEGSVGCVNYFYDFDGDGFGVDEYRCLCAEFGYYDAITLGDCDDFDAGVSPAELNCGLWGPVSTSEAAAIAIPGPTVVLDYNRDGWADLVLADASESTLYTGAGAVYLWLGSSDGWSGTYEASPLSDSDFRFLSDGLSHYCGSRIGGGDVDGDGFSELIVGCPGEDTTYFIDDGLTGVGTVTPETEGVTSLPYIFAGVAADLDQDSRHDILVEGINYTTCSGLDVVYAGETEPAGSEFGCVSRGYVDRHVAVGDLNGTGTLEVVTVGYGGYSSMAKAGLGVYLADEVLGYHFGHSIHAYSISSGSANRESQHLSVEDVDGDGYDDAVISRASGRPIHPFLGHIDYGGLVYVFAGNASGFLSDAAGERALDWDDPALRIAGSSAAERVGAGFDVMDINNDGSPDIVGGGGQIFYGPIALDGAMIWTDTADATIDSYGYVYGGIDMNEDSHDDFWLGYGDEYHLFLGTP